ncbi:MULTISPECIES: CBS domain-containing protein [unclassified Rhizobium]|uniref:CBS domain-containing protein n=1 Tax=unclassified Rhizobium TaxID=2613769 RepID=UPI00286E6262|nr:MULTISPECIES: CBS domain-containing protein [unclassified Rhizobium]MCS3743595.1 CBS domain-containing protein [Rhizobium sp. BK661]MCS4096197.1 CBS domain-containing protein [Rhizobium sp. BK176]
MIVENAMTPSPITIGESATVFVAASLMLPNRISGLPIVDDDGVLIGMISGSDFLRRHELKTDRRRSWLQIFLTSPGKMADEYVRTHGRLVKEVMNPHLLVTTPTAALSDAVLLMERNCVKRLPVVSEGRLVGIISRSDLLRALARTQNPSVPSVEDTKIQDAVEAELAKQTWSRNGLIRCQARNGIAELAGTIFDERERLAAKVAAENVPGVKSTTDHLIWLDPTTASPCHHRQATRNGFNGCCRAGREEPRLKTNQAPRKCLGISSPRQRDSSKGVVNKLLLR